LASGILALLAKTTENRGKRPFPKTGTASAKLKAIRNNRGTYEGQVSGSKTMTNQTSVREISQLMSVAMAALLFGSTMILSAVGPARASEAPILAAHPGPAPLRYLA
jgi:hypothetical protein